MAGNPLLRLQELGQCVWLDDLGRALLEGGELQKLIDEDGVHGVTSNPAIFAKSIAGDDVYDEAIATMAARGDDTPRIYRRLTVDDVRGAADLLRPLYDRTDGRHGFASLEVDPHLAHETEDTVAQARELWRDLDRPNVFIKVPATRAGLPAIRRLVSEGINVNVTLLFGLPRYLAVTRAYLDGLRDRAAAGGPLDRVASVASFFLSRIDTMVDRELDDIAAADDDRAESAQRLRGEAAIASARLAYRIYRQAFAPDAFGELAVRGARPQRVLWASTSAKDPSYPATKYVDGLVGRETINTMPRKTLDAYRKEGEPALRLDGGETRAKAVLRELAELGIDMDEIADRLEAEGVVKFQEPYDESLDRLESRRAAAAEGTGRASKGEA